MAVQRRADKRRTATGRWGEILDAAAQIFYTQGYEATSIQDVADALGILKGSLYHYIDSKEDLLFGVVERFHERGREHLAEALELRGSTAEILFAFAARFVEHNIEDIVSATVLNHDLRSLNPEHRAAIVETRDRYDRFLRRLIEEGIGTGEVRSDLDPKLTSIGIMSMLNSIYVWYRPGGTRTVEEIAQAFGDLVVWSVCTEPVAGSSVERRPAARPNGALP